MRDSGSQRAGRNPRSVVKKLPSALLALGRSSPPKVIQVAGNEYRLAHLFKHDFFACTGLYVGPAGKVVLKLGRQADILGFPAQWIGRFLAAREAAAYQALNDLESVPRFLGRWGSTGIVHEFIEGRPLRRDEPVPDEFFERLTDAIETLHAREMAYVDLEKPQNVLVGDDGKPYLIDFQIAWHLPARFGGRTWLARWVRRRLQQGDCYHLLKLQRRIRRDQLTPEQIRRSYRKPFYVKIHAWLTSPLTKMRRRTLSRLDPSRKIGERGTLPDHGELYSTGAERQTKQNRERERAVS